MIVPRINEFLQAELIRRELDCATAVEVGGWLDNAGLLRDSASRPGKPLRDLLRAGLITGQRQEMNGRWFICRTDDATAPFPGVARRTETPRSLDATLDVVRIVAYLLDPANRVPANGWPRQVGHLRIPGLYSWWVDFAGAHDLGTGLGLPIAPGLIYAGQTGAGTSSATLASRIGNNHLRGNVRGSTFRWTLATILEGVIGLAIVGSRKLEPGSEVLLNDWIGDHLSVAMLGVPGRETLLATEAEVLRSLDPPLNLQGMPYSRTRSKLSLLRRRIGGSP